MNLSDGPKPKMSNKWWAVITWILAFAIPEILGLVAGSVSQDHHITAEYVSILEWTVMITGSFGFLYIISRFTRVRISEAIYVHRPVIQIAYPLLLGAFLIVPISFASNSYSIPLLGVNSFLKSNSLLAFPFEILYYFSEIVVVTYMYIIAASGWAWRKGPFTSGTIFVIVGWAALHAITKNIFVALVAVGLAIILFLCYEYSKSPLVPILLWFTFLIV